MTDTDTMPSDMKYIFAVYKHCSPLQRRIIVGLCRAGKKRLAYRVVRLIAAVRR